MNQHEGDGVAAFVVMLLLMLALLFILMRKDLERSKDQIVKDLKTTARKPWQFFLDRLREVANALRGK